MRTKPCKTNLIIQGKSNVIWSKSIQKNDCYKISYHNQQKGHVKHKGSSLQPFRKELQEKKHKVWLLQEQKWKKKFRKLLKQLQNNMCSMPYLMCFTHDL